MILSWTPDIYPWKYVTPSWRVYLITGAAETNIVVRIARGIVQIQRERSRVARVIPIAAT